MPIGTTMNKPSDAKAIWCVIFGKFVRHELNGINMLSHTHALSPNQAIRGANNIRTGTAALQVDSLANDDRRKNEQRSHDRCDEKSVILGRHICHRLSGIMMLSHTHALPPNPPKPQISETRNPERRTQNEQRRTNNEEQRTTNALPLLR